MWFVLKPDRFVLAKQRLTLIAPNGVYSIEGYTTFDTIRDWTKNSRLSKLGLTTQFDVMAPNGTSAPEALPPPPDLSRIGNPTNKQPITHRDRSQARGWLSSFHNYPP
jgi:hypothetical protein